MCRPAAVVAGEAHWRATAVLLVLVGIVYNNGPAARAEVASWPVCNGYDPLQRTWGPKSSEENLPALCPSGFAFLSVSDPLGPRRPPEKVYTEGYCCELPAGSLSTVESYTGEGCPDGSVATGAVVTPEYRYLLRCHAIEQAKFSLGPPVAGRTLSFAQEDLRDLLDQVLSRFGRAPMDPVTWEDLPIALRSGLGRRSKETWNWEICLGLPFPSVLVAKHGERCSEHEFRELRSRTTLENSVLSKTPVPDCRAIDESDPDHPRCVP